VVLAIVVGIFATLRDPFIQTFAARTAATYLSDQIGSTVTIGRFYFDLNFSLTLQDVYVADKQDQTLFRADNINVRLLSSKFRNGLSLSKVSVSGIDLQLIVYEGQEKLNLQFILDYFNNAGDVEENKETAPYPIHISSFELDRANFRYWDQNKDDPENKGIDYAHLNMSDIHVKLTNFFILGDSMNGHIQKLGAVESAGLILKQLQGFLTLTPSKLKLHELELVMNKSILNLELEMAYNGFHAFLDFIDSVHLQVFAHPSKLYMADLGYFAPVMFDMTNSISFAGEFYGPVSELSAKDMSFSYGNSTRFLGDISLSGLPDIYHTRADLQIVKLETTVADLQRFAIPGEIRYLPLPEQMLLFGNISINGLFKGYYNDFNANATFKTGLGVVATDLLLSQEEKAGEIAYKGSLKTLDLDLGKLLNTPQTIGKMNMNLVVDGTGLTEETAQMNLNGMIHSLEFMDNEFRDVQLAGDFSGQDFNGKIIADDKKLKFDFLGMASFSQTPPSYNFVAELYHADLYNLHLLSMDTLMHLKTSVEANFSGSDFDELTGSISITNSHFIDSRGSYQMDTFNLTKTHSGMYPAKLTLHSDFIDLTMGGEIDFANLTNAFKQYVGQYVEFRDFKPDSDTIEEQDLFFNVHLKNTETLSRLFMPSLTLSPDARFSGVFTNFDLVLNTTFRAKQLTLGTIKLNDLALNTHSNLWLSELQLSSSQVIFRDSTENEPTVLGLYKPELRVGLASDSVRFSFLWADNQEIASNRGAISGFYAALSEKQHELRISNADLLVNNSAWTISPGNRILFTGDYTQIEDLKLQVGDQSIAVNGRIPLTEADSLSIYFNTWDISHFDLLLQGTGLDFDGVIDGELALSNLLNQPAFISNLRLLELFLNNEKLGEAHILSSWNSIDESLYLNTQIVNTGNISTSRMLSLRGFYYPGRTSNSLALNLALENFRLRTIAPFLKGVLSRVEGLASGNLDISGSLNEPEMHGSLSLMRTAFLIDYLNVKYSLSHEFNIASNRIDFNDLILFDTIGNKAAVNGNITHDYFKNFKFNLFVNPTSFLALNTNKEMNELFYGSAVVSGEVYISGEINDVELNIKALTHRGTQMTIPLSSTTTVYDNNYIIFVNNESVVDVEKEVIKPQVTGFNINLETMVTPEAGLRIFLPDNMGNLEASGNGNIKLGVNSMGDFSLVGDYVVQSGQFNFVFENLVRRRFDLMEGGRISWTGDPYDADIDLRGVYRLKTSLTSLGPSIDSTKRSRINVEAVIHLTDQLFNPTINFSIRLPNADEEMNSLVFSVIDTTNDAMMTQQILSLLVLGSFSYTGGENASIGASSFSFISGQLSNWLSQISKNFDIGLHYKPGDKLSDEELEVALSTQLFNDRVTIDGNFGVIGNRQTNENASNIVGDVDINVLLTPDGRLRMKAFNHSNTSTWFNLRAYEDYSPYTQGVGFSYRQEFDRFGDLFRRKRKQILNTQ
jgi:hypothetical protein